MSRPPRRIAAGVYQVGTGGANVFLIDLSEDGRPAAKASADDGAAPGGLVLIDAGIDSEATAIGRAIRDLGRTPADLRAVVVTHFHGDHVGGLAKVRTHTNAETWMHPVDAALVRDGTTIRPLAEGPGRVRSVLARMINRRPAKPREPITVEREIGDGSAGHLALLLPRDGGVLFVGDAATNFARLSHGPIHEDLAESERSLRKLAALDFQVAAFAHGRPIRGGAAERFRRRWPA
jgi:glyoxylase-like metal-dependent hydrolase (beta-lactamase superfamily II)